MKHFKTLMGMYRYCWRHLGKDSGTVFVWRFGKWVGDGYTVPELPAIN